MLFRGKIFFYQKSVGFNWCFDPIVNIKKNYKDWVRPTSKMFFIFFEKDYNDWIKCKLPKSRFKWTGLRSWCMYFLLLIQKLTKIMLAHSGR